MPTLKNCLRKLSLHKELNEQSNEWMKIMANLQERILCWTIRLITTSTLWLEFLNSTSASWKTPSFLKSVSLTLYLPPVSHTQENVSFFFFYIVIINPFFLFSRAWLGCWKSSSYTADNCDSSTACDRGHEIPVCFSKPVSLIRTTLRFVLLVLYLQQFICLEVSPSTVMRTWWTLTTLLSALAQLWCPYQTTRILWPVKRTLMRSLRQSSSITRPSSQPNENSKDLFMKNAWQGWRSTGRWTGAHNKKIPTSPTSASY